MQPRSRWRSLAVGLSAVALLSGSLPVGAVPTSQVGANAPDNLRCPGREVPQPPGEGWQVLPVWEWRHVVDVEGQIGSNDGPYAVALDRNCNIYLTDSLQFQVLKLSPNGEVVARWRVPGDRAPGESSSPRGVAVDTSGNVYVTDTPRDRIHKLSPQGQVIATWGVCETPKDRKSVV